MKYLLAISLLICVALFQGASAKVVKGQLQEPAQDWHFLDKFCFDTSGKGQFSWTIYTSDPNADLRMLFYDDVADSWPAVWKDRKKLACSDKIARAAANRTIENGVTQTEYFLDVVRPHFWYFAITNCNGANKLELSYTLTFLQAAPGWNQQFSFDEAGLAQAFLFFWFLFSALLIVQIVATFQLVRMISFHPIVRLLLATFVLNWLYVFCTMIHYLVYKNNGVGAPGLKGLGEVMDMAGQVVFIFLLLLLAKGWTITTNELEGKKIFAGVLSSFLLMFIILFIWENVGQDPASTLYTYETVPGILILILRVATLFLFLWWLRGSQLAENDAGKKKFYLMFGGVYTLWFLALPFIVILAAIIAAWTRLKVVMIFYLLIHFFTLSFLAFLLWPTRAASYFQIGGKGGALLEGSSNTPYDRL